MDEHHALLDAFTDTRRTWDELVSLQPDIVAGAGQLTEEDLVELERRVDAHRAAVDALADVIETEPRSRLLSVCAGRNSRGGCR